MNSEALLLSLYEAERNARRLHEQLSQVDEAELLTALEKDARDALVGRGDASDAAEATLRLVRIATLLAGLGGSTAVDLLIDILNAESPEVRLAAGEAVQILAERRFKEVAVGAERALTRLPPESAALVELPYLLVDFADGGAATLLTKFLKHPEAEVAAAAVDALGEMGDASAIGALKALVNDPRQVTIEGTDEGTEQVSLGDLAAEAIEILEESFDA